MSKICFLLDENMPHAVRDQLLLHESSIGVFAVGDDTAPVLGTPDPDILAWIEANNAVLVSRNRRTIPDHLQDHLTAGGHVPGILLLRRRCTLGQVITDLLLIWNASKPDEYKDRIEYLPL